MILERIIYVKARQGRLFVRDNSGWRPFKPDTGTYYLVKKDTFERLIDGVYNKAHGRESDVDAVMLRVKDDLRDSFPPAIEFDDGYTYHLTQEFVYVRGQEVCVRYVTPELSLEEVIDETKGVGD